MLVPVMWGVVTGALRAGSVQILGTRQPVISAVFWKRWLQRVNVCAMCSYKNSAIGQMLGVNTKESANENIIQKYTSAIPFDKAENDRLLIHKPDQPGNPKVLRVVMLGAPNAGKSTLSNKLLGRKVFPVSKKVHTTRCQAQGILTEGETQVVLLDTPGMVDKQKVRRHKLERSLQNDPWDSMKSADVVLVLVDVSEQWTRRFLHVEVLKCLFQYPNITSILVMNKESTLYMRVWEAELGYVDPEIHTEKAASRLYSPEQLQQPRVDLVKQKGLLLEIVNQLTEGIVNDKKAVIKSLGKPNSDTDMSHTSVTEDNSPSVCEEPEVITDEPAAHDMLSPGGEEDARKKRINKLKRKGWPHFQEVFMLSAIDGEEVETLKKYLLTLAKPGEWEYHSDVVTTQTPQEICDNTIREKLLEYLPKEIPYGVTQVTDLWEEGTAGQLVIKQTLFVAKENHVKLLIGPSGELVGKIAREAGEDLMNIFHCDVRLRLAVKYKK
uniref:GTPase Era, mitochondrial n=1 Tax=Leptobrachium leishanense TaxID=445787 RepID=A0A8C5PMA6_9ANUR